MVAFIGTVCNGIGEFVVVGNGVDGVFIDAVVVSGTECVVIVVVVSVVIEENCDDADAIVVIGGDVDCVAVIDVVVFIVTGADFVDTGIVVIIVLEVDCVGICVALSVVIALNRVNVDAFGPYCVTIGVVVFETDCDIIGVVFVVTIIGVDWFAIDVVAFAVIDVVAAVGAVCFVINVAVVAPVLIVVRFVIASIPVVGSADCGDVGKIEFVIFCDIVVAFNLRCCAQVWQHFCCWASLLHWLLSQAAFLSPYSQPEKQLS